MFEHGDPVIVIGRNEFLELLDELRLACSVRYKRLPEIEKVLRDARGYHHSEGHYVDLEKEMGPEPEL